MRYFIVALVVSLAWLHQDWFVWPLLADLDNQKNFLSWLVAEEHEVKFGIPANVGFQIFLSVATAFVALIAVWKSWPKELERWAEAGGYRGRGRGRGRGGRNRPRSSGGKNSGESKSSNRQTSRPESSGDSSGRSSRRRHRGGRSRGGNGEGNSQSQQRAGE